MTESTKKRVFSALGINKSFPGVRALCDVDFDLYEGEVHALVGENGAGKSTLSHIIGGSQRQDEGMMELNGLPYNPSGRSAAEALGVRMVMQELNLIGNLSISENIFLKNLPGRLGIIDYNRLNKDAQTAMAQVGLGDIDVTWSVKLLGVGQKQMVEIAAGLSQKCRVLILDEPTAALTDKEIELLMERIEKLKSEGVSIIYISHRIEEVMRIADRVTVLRDGKVVCTKNIKDVNANNIISMMVGREISEEIKTRKRKFGATALKVENLNAGDKVKNVGFEVHRGEIFGIAGLMGSGRTETARVLFGADRRNSGKIFLYNDTTAVRIDSCSDAVGKGIGFVSEDRKELGLLLSLSVRGNITLGKLKELSRLGIINSSRESKEAEEYAEKLGIRCSSIEQVVGQLSGGNQQKTVIAKWLYKDCDILIFDEPTRGIDIGARFEIYQLLEKLADEGKAIIVISSDIKELMTICDTISVMSAGRIADIFGPDEWSEEKINYAAFSGYVKS